jgi:hypothetical protein
MTTLMPAVAVYSNDHDFINMIHESNFAAIVSNGNNTGHSIRSVSSDINGLADHDVIIYDLDMANESVLQAKEDILHLKLNSRSLPLLLVGKKEFMQTVISTANITHFVDRMINKPVFASHLKIVIDATLSSQVDKRAASNAPQTKNPVLAFGSNCLSVLGGAIGINSTQNV